MNKIISTVFVFVLLFATVVSADDDNVYQGLSNFTRVLDLVERNYVEDVDAGELTTSAIEGMLRTLDPYSAYLTPERFRELEIGTSGEFGGVGMEVTLEDDVLTVVTPIEDTPASRAGIEPGDQIVEIEGKSTRGLIVQEAVKLLRGPKGSPVTITIRNPQDGSTREVTLIRDIVVVKSVRGKLLDNNIGYIKLSQFQENTTSELKEAMTVIESGNGGNLEGLILDLRNNPGGLLDQAIEVVDQFMGKGLIVSVKGRDPSQVNEYYATDSGELRDYPLVVIVNKGSASASEVVAEALQDTKRALILGTKTFGKGSVQTIIRLDDGSGLKLTTAKFYAPSGRSINEVGVVPDIVIENEKGKDKQLDKAIELIKSSELANTLSKG